MDSNVGSSENVSNNPHDMDELAKELDSMSVEDLKEEYKIIVSEMDENASCGDLLALYLDTIARKDPRPEYMDPQPTYEDFLKRVKAENKKRRSIRILLKVGVAAAVIIALMVASMAVAYAKGFDLFDRIATWTAETFGLSSKGAAGKDGTEIPPQLQGMKEALEQYSLGPGYLPSYWINGYEQSTIQSLESPDSNVIIGTYGADDNRLVVSFIQYLSGVPKESYNIDDQSLEIYEHNGIKFHIMTNMGNYLAVWTSETVECRLSGLDSYEDLIKILDSIGGSKT